MSVYVDTPVERGWRLRGREVANSHMFTDQIDLAELHEMAARIGMKRSWFQNSRVAPHYDLTPSRFEDALGLGAIHVARAEAVRIWRTRRAMIAACVAQPVFRRPPAPLAKFVHCDCPCHRGRNIMHVMRCCPYPFRIKGAQK